MMCLGWDNNPICRPAPDTVTIVPPSTAAPASCPAAPGVPGVQFAPCPDITWFYIASALVIGGAVLKGAIR